MRPEITCRFPELGVRAGYAATVVVSAQSLADGARAVHRHRYWEYLESVPSPRIVVVHDADEPRAVGAFLGEVNGAIHRGLGCVAAITDGGIRDVSELRSMDLQTFASSVITSAGYMHIVDFGVPVNVGGLQVRSGDLLHVDQHGVVSVPIEVAGRIPATAAQIRKRELEVVDLYRSGAFDLDALKRIRPQ